MSGRKFMPRVSERKSVAADNPSHRWIRSAISDATCCLDCGIVLYEQNQWRVASSAHVTLPMCRVCLGVVGPSRHG
jgi:hypothetical protein